MRKWTDKAIKQHVEDLIEESYILTLPEDEIREYFIDFVDSCDHVLRSNISIHGDLRTIRIKSELLRARLYVNEHNTPPVNHGRRDDNPSDNFSPKSQSGANRSQSDTNRNELFAEQIVKVKSIIIKLFEQFNPIAAKEIVQEFDKRFSLRKKSSKRRTLYYNFLLIAGFYSLLFSAIALIFYIIFHQSVD